MSSMLAMSAILAASKSKTSSSGDIDLLLIVALVVVFYFFVMRPRSQRQRQQREQVRSAEVGDEIQTIGGLVGTIVAEDGDRVTVSTGNGTELVFLRAAIGRKITAPAGDRADAPDTEAAPDGDAGASGTT